MDRRTLGRSLLGLALAAATASCSHTRSPPEEAAIPAPPPETRVAAGESACRVAGRVGVSPEALLAANGLRPPADRPLGRERVVVPDDAPLRHRVQTGDTLGAVASWYGLPLDEVARANGIDDPDRIAAGAWLRIPPGARTGCAPPPNVARTRPAPKPVASAPPPPVAAAPPAPVGLSPEQRARADDLLAQAGDRYQAAHFREVVRLASDAEAVLDASDDAASRARRARAAWLAGLAYAGLDERDAALQSLHRALALQPSLRDDPSLSPRIREMLAESPAPRVAVEKP
jgi:LysM repeat protein